MTTRAEGVALAKQVADLAFDGVDAAIELTRTAATERLADKAFENEVLAHMMEGWLLALETIETMVNQLRKEWQER